MKHYQYGGSTAARTIACPSWVKLASALPKAPQAVSPFAVEGTMMHSMIEQFLDGGEDFESSNEINVDQVERLNEAVKAWDEFCVGEKIEDYELEVEMSLSDKIGGTSDVVAWAPKKRAIVDWKFGQGMEVEAVGNMQLLFYAMLDEHTNPSENDELVVAIIQPMPSRSGHKTLKTWNVPYDVFQLFKQSFMRAVTSEGLQSGSHCQWCPVAPTCPERTGEARAALMASPEDLSTLAENVDTALNLEAWIADVKTFAHQQLELGAKIEGFKLVQKRAQRKWEVPDAANQVLRKMRKLKVTDITEQKLLSPAKMEKVFKAKSIDFAKMDAYISKSSSGTTLAREEDPRDGVMSVDALKAALGRLS